MLRLEDFLRMCVEKQGSDVHFKTDAGKIYLRVHGDLELVEGVETYSNEQFTKALYVLLNDHQIERFQKELELDFALEIEGVARF